MHRWWAQPDYLCPCLAALGLLGLVCDNVAAEFDAEEHPRFRGGGMISASSGQANFLNKSHMHCMGQHSKWPWA